MSTSVKATRSCRCGSVPRERESILHERENIRMNVGELCECESILRQRNGISRRREGVLWECEIQGLVRVTIVHRQTDKCTLLIPKGNFGNVRTYYVNARVILLVRGPFVPAIWYTNFFLVQKLVHLSIETTPEALLFQRNVPLATSF